MSRAFTRLFDSNGIGVNADHIAKFNEYCSATDSKRVFTAAYKFQRKAVLGWNPNADKVTMSFNMGFIGIREDSAVICYSSLDYYNITMTTLGSSPQISTVEDYIALGIGSPTRTAPRLCQR